jgi:hypothetical protein
MLFEQNNGKKIRYGMLLTQKKDLVTTEDVLLIAL